ncbi:hypothetical protein C4577_00565 [Candidatus Parcubacteria bacterium]|nr:MAG: hypothetical protein C4577_00565 [Candidatus Parcubacteria bacterium]
MAFEHTNAKGTKYYLNSKKVILRGSGREQTIYYFTRQPTENSIDSVPEGFMVVENPRTGLPVLKRE